MRLLGASPTGLVGPLGDPPKMMRVVIDAERQHLADRESSQKRMWQPILSQRRLGPALHGDLHGPHRNREAADACTRARRQVGWGRLPARCDAACVPAGSECRLIVAAELG